ncbi:MAG: hypothetical protein HY675_27050, partial [Chloroflexi bacterium]|nr:hypothetical protein [Chloroflexota bacterium]
MIDQKGAKPNIQEAIAKTWQMVEKYALKKGYVLNPDRASLEKTVRSMARRQ